MAKEPSKWFIFCIIFSIWTVSRLLSMLWICLSINILFYQFKAKFFTFSFLVYRRLSIKKMGIYSSGQPFKRQLHLKRVRNLCHWLNSNSCFGAQQLRWYIFPSHLLNAGAEQLDLAKAKHEKLDSPWSDAGCYVFNLSDLKSF